MFNDDGSRRWRAPAGRAEQRVRHRGEAGLLWGWSRRLTVEVALCSHGMATPAAGPGRFSRDTVDSGWDSGMTATRRPGLRASPVALAYQTPVSASLKPCVELEEGELDDTDSGEQEEDDQNSEECFGYCNFVTN